MGGFQSCCIAIDGARTRGLDLGKVARYQLRHYRICNCILQSGSLMVDHINSYGRPGLEINPYEMMAFLYGMGFSICSAVTRSAGMMLPKPSHF